MQQLANHDYQERQRQQQLEEERRRQEQEAANSNENGENQDENQGDHNNQEEQPTTEKPEDITTTPPPTTTARPLPVPNLVNHRNFNSYDPRGGNVGRGQPPQLPQVPPRDFNNFANVNNYNRDRNRDNFDRDRERDRDYPRRPSDDFRDRDRNLDNHRDTYDRDTYDRDRVRNVVVGERRPRPFLNDRRPQNTYDRDHDRDDRRQDFRNEISDNYRRNRPQSSYEFDRDQYRGRNDGRNRFASGSRVDYAAEEERNPNDGLDNLRSLLSGRRPPNRPSSVYYGQPQTVSRFRCVIES